MMYGKQVQTRRIVFTSWTRWADRASLKNVRSPGVYILAHFRKVPSGPANPLAKQVIYIGETCSNSLIGRWRQFDRAALQGKHGHSGGITYRDEIGGKGGRLYVAAVRVPNLGESALPYFIRYVERRLIWEFYQKWAAPPRCNRK